MVYVTLKYGPFANDTEAREFIRSMEQTDLSGALMDAYVVNQYNVSALIPDINEDND